MTLRAEAPDDDTMLRVERPTAVRLERIGRCDHPAQEGLAHD
jgi:hypothetical protein